MGFTVPFFNIFSFHYYMRNALITVFLSLNNMATNHFFFCFFEQVFIQN